MASSQKRIMLWATPRSLSTAMCRVMLNSGMKTKILFEPYSESYYFGPERTSRRYEQRPPDLQRSFSSMKKKLEMPYPEAKLVFAKDMPYYLSSNRLTTDWIPDGYKHTFITRHPRATVLSYMRVIEQGLPGWEKFDPVESGYKELVEMYHLLQQQGHKVIILDADDLMENPEGTLRAYCREVGIQFRPSMLNWDPLPETDFLNIFCVVWEPQWFHTVGTSNGLIQRPKKRASGTDVTSSCYDPETLDLIDSTVQKNLGYYQELHNQRLNAEQTANGSAEMSALSTLPRLSSVCSIPVWNLHLQSSSTTLGVFFMLSVLGCFLVAVWY